MENTTQKIKVSIICPAYNCEDFIDKTIESAMSQTHSNWELIIVDDNSSDGTVKRVEKYEDKRIRLFRNSENKGAAYSRNLALEKAEGEYIAFLDGDDYWLSDKLEDQLKFMVEGNIHFSYTNYYVLNNEENKINTYITGPKIVTRRKLLRADYMGCLTVMYKKSLLPSLKIPNNIRKRNDYALWLLLSEKSSCYLLNKRLSVYRKRKNTISSSSKLNLFKNHVFLFKTLYNFSTIKSVLFASRNAFYYVLKIIFYRKKVRADSSIV